MNLEAVDILIKTNAKLSQTNREMWDYIHSMEVPNLDNYKRLTDAVQELVSTLEKHPSRDIVQEGSYRYLKEILLDIKNTNMDRNKSP